MNTNSSFLLLGLILFSSTLFAQQEVLDKGLQAINPAAIKAQLDFLSSDVMMGRNTGEKGGFIASEYIASIMATYGVTPGGDMKTIREERTASWGRRNTKKYRSFFQDFSLLRYRPGDEQYMEIHSATEDGSLSLILDYGTDYKVSVHTTGREFTAPLVFVGYGITDEESSWDDYKGLDLTGKILVRCYGYPGRGDTVSRGYEAFHSRIKNWRTSPLSNRGDWTEGALAVIDIPEYRDPMERWTTNDPDTRKPDWYHGEKDYNWDEWRMDLATDSIDTRPVRITLSKRAWNLIADGSGIDLESYKKAAAELKHVKPKLLPGKRISIISTTESEIITGRNVVGLIPGADTTRCIVIGAHYDHLGSWDGYIYNGADDNASGTIGVLTMAGALMATGEKPPVTVVLAAWTGEEKGLLGSEYYVQNPIIPLDQTILNINFDMISRSATTDSLKNKCSMTYSKGRDDLKKISETNLDLYSIDLKVRFRPSTGEWGGSDYVPFGRKKIPFIGNMAGFHTEYHTPADDSWKCDSDKLARIVKLNFLTLWDLAGTKED